ncbi:hypothetical protein Cgig2_009264 [Carnegiea gigantea]|uniref:Uncharacterized protein n=1 Tax=Carnegiea gigantea TaxID=171969 RepID=A0A9Q1K0I3_9CARY|nr:hypothetical protein Cgig2_009264 [Carnegiea gigantea]
MNKPLDPVSLLLFTLLIIWTTSKLIHDAPLAFLKTSHGLLSHFKLPHLVFVPGVPQFPLGPCKSEDQLLSLISPFITPHKLTLLYHPNFVVSDGHLDVECKSFVQIDDDKGYSEPLQHTAPLQHIASRITHYLWPIIRSINQIGVDSSLVVCFGAQVRNLCSSSLFFFFITLRFHVEFADSTQCYSQEIHWHQFTSPVKTLMYKEEFSRGKQFFMVNLFMKNWIDLSSGKIILLTLQERAQTLDINIHGPNIKLSLLGTSMYCIAQKLKKIKLDLKSWSECTFGNFKQKLEKNANKLLRVEQKLVAQPNSTCLNNWHYRLIKQREKNTFVQLKILGKTRSKGFAS